MSLSSVSALFHDLPITDRLHLATRAPAPWLVTGEDRLRLTVRNGATGVTVRVSGRFLTADAVIIPISFDLTPATDFSASSTDVALGDGWILNLTARVSAGTPQTGQTWLIVDVVRGSGTTAITLGTLIGGYVSASSAPAWPGSEVRLPSDGLGASANIAGADPAAGAEWTITIPAGLRFLVRSFVATFVTDATVANREPSFVFTIGGSIVAVTTLGGAQTASLTKRYDAFFAGVRGFSATNSEGVVPLPEVLMNPGDTITSVTTNLQAGDNWGAPIANGIGYVA